MSIIDSHINSADLEIKQCLDFKKLTSFFLFAGAGSGKTRSLINALTFLNSTYGRVLQFAGRKIAVITYTNAACDEIKQRIEFNTLFEISTIHSFVWSLINNFHSDIKHWLIEELNIQLQELKEQQAKGRAGTKAAIDRAASINSKEERLEKLYAVKKFTYNPNGENAGIDALSHSEVLKIGADFLNNKPLLQSIIIGKYPILFIDESQDTNKLLMESFLKLELNNKGNFLLGLFGDTMQRIYADGKLDLGQNLPSHWSKPEKKTNHRSSKRIVDLVNKIRSDIDNHQQQAVIDKEDGFTRLFVLPSDITDKEKQEKEIRNRMAIITGDDSWKKTDAVKQLILEHHMAAKRLNFLDMYTPLYSIDKYRTGLLDGSLSAVRFFSTLVRPIIKAKQNNDGFAIAKLLRTHSPLLAKNILQASESDQPGQIKKVHEAVNDLFSLCEKASTSFMDVLNLLDEKKLFIIPNSLQLILDRNKATLESQIGNIVPDEEGSEEDKIGTEEIVALETFLNTPFNQIENYSLYIEGASSFDTHQGVKGRQFPKVMVIIDDSEARGFLFKYDKLFGVEPPTQTDINNEKEGNDTSFKRARRLFYVTASRAEKSLAIVAYSKSPIHVKDFAIKNGWFDDSEIELL